MELPNFWEVFTNFPKYDAKIVLDDFNAKIRKEDIFGRTVGKHSLHDTTSGNGLRLIEFAAGQNVTIASTRFPHLNIHKGTWRSPDHETVNQIDPIAIDARHASSILYVRTFRAANINSDHYLVAAKVRMRIVQTPQRRITVRRFNVESCNRKRPPESSPNAYPDISPRLLCCQHQVPQTSGNASNIPSVTPQLMCWVSFDHHQETPV